MSNYDFSQPTRQALAGLILFWFNGARVVVKNAWALFLVFFVNINNERFTSIQDYVYLVLAGLTLILMVHAWLFYRYFYFSIEQGELLIHKGYLKKVKLSIPFERIQNINIKQNLLQRFLQVVSIEVDTAGSSGKELKIIALKREQAVALKKELIELKEALLDTTGENENPSEIVLGASGKKTVQTNSDLVPVLHLDPVDLIKVGITENHLKSSLLIVAVLIGFMQQLSEVFQERLEAMEEQAKLVLIGAGVQLILILVFVLLAAGFLFSLIRVFLSHYNLRMARNQRQYAISMGLFNKKEWTIPFRKIQVYEWKTNPLRDRMNFVTVYLHQAVSKEIHAQQTKIQVPGVSLNKRTQIEKSLFPELESSDYQEFRPNAIYFRRAWIIVGWIPAILLSLNYFAIQYWAAIPVVSWLLLSYVWSRLNYRKRLFRIGRDLVQDRSGAIGTSWQWMYLYKIQAVRLRRNIWERRRKLSTIFLYSASGEVLSIPYVDSAVAWRLYQWFLYRIETSEESWM